ncbi:MAG TPA: hypothetical protein VH436_16965 [Vicinamibacterales bacterium]
MCEIGPSSPRSRIATAVSASMLYRNGMGTAAHALFDSARSASALTVLSSMPQGFSIKKGTPASTR